jgi:hypothetical protein
MATPGEVAAREAMSAAAVAVKHAARAGGAAGRPAAKRERAAQSLLMRDIFGNPFRPPPAPDPSWLRWGDGTVPNLARAVYEGRAFERLPILADALEEAGCIHADVLGHLRGGGPHAVGCWALDWVLGKG